MGRRRCAGENPDAGGAVKRGAENEKPLTDTGILQDIG